MNKASPPPIPGPLTLTDKSEEDLYAMAMAEMKSESRRQGLWARALSEAMGDEPKAEALYIRYRTEQLVEEQDSQRRAKIEADRATPVIFKCPQCGKKLQLTKGHLSDTATSKYPNWHRCCPGCGKSFDCRSAIPSTSYKLPPPLPVRKPQSQKRTDRSGLSSAQSGVGYKILAVAVFLILMFIGTYFARVSNGGIGAVFIGYTFGAMAFIVAPILWRKK